MCKSMLLRTSRPVWLITFATIAQLLKSGDVIEKCFDVADNKEGARPTINLKHRSKLIIMERMGHDTGIVIHHAARNE